jgi:hypothetical protein
VAEIVPASSCRQLAQIIEESMLDQDALKAFAEVHLCICARVEEQTAAHSARGLEELNEQFTARFIEVYDRFIHRGQAPPALPLPWKLAFWLYRLKPTRYLSCITTMAAAHIAVDLYHVLCHMDAEVSIEQFESVNAIISACLDAVGMNYAGVAISNEVWENVGKLLVPLAVDVVAAGRMAVYELASDYRQRLRS